MSRKLIETIFTCSNCDSQFPKWQGRCGTCGQWGTIEAGAPTIKSARPTVQGKPGKTIGFTDISGDPVARVATTSAEFDRTLGGGIVPGSLILLGGEPGIGKSTLALQVTAGLKKPVLYISGEESGSQVKLRYERLGLKAPHVRFLSETDVPTVLATIAAEKPALVVVDSVQTLFDPTLPSEAGSVVQIRVVTVKLMALAKQLHIPILLIGHVTKDGTIAGPRMLEHLVDCVLTMEGDPHHAYRILRATKNRFGATDEVGVFDMVSTGLVDVPNPSERFLAERPTSASGSAVVPVIEGTRVFLLDIQALVSTTVFGYPQRVSAGFDGKRLQLLLAVLGKRAGLGLGNQDVHLNVVGGFRIEEPAADLGVCLAVASSLQDKALPERMAAVGEVGLGGEIRGTSNMDRRLAECAKLGFTTVLCPPHTKVVATKGLAIVQVRTVHEALLKASLGK
ncbi:MAG: DNA repair protein RadA [Patescibacteria group bacterium]